MNGESMKAKEFRHSVLRNAKRQLFLPDPAMESCYLAGEGESEEKEVKVNMRFLPK